MNIGSLRIKSAYFWTFPEMSGAVCAVFTVGFTLRGSGHLMELNTFEGYKGRISLSRL